MSTQALPSAVSALPGRRLRARGVTLIETLCTMSVLTTLAGIALPSLNTWRESQTLRSVAAELETDVHFARSAAVASQQTVRLETQALGNGSCYLVHTGGRQACTCTGRGQASCTGDAQVIRLSEQPADGAVTLSSTQLSIAFDPQRGTVTPTATIKITDSRGRAIHQIVNIMGRVRSCSPRAGVSGIKAC